MTEINGIKGGKSNLSVCVFCASSDHLPNMYIEPVRKLGREMVKRGITLVYGGGNNGLMGILSKTIYEGGGYIIGVIPRRLKELGYAFDGADEMIVTDGMRERKAIMEEHADGFIGLPGGFGTLEEMLEIVTLKQLDMLNKPIVFLNINGFFDGLLAQFETGYSEHFIDETCRGLYRVTESVKEALDEVQYFFKKNCISQ
ncbi:TIGR00730 family Rossman fold protein [Candidatus Latescibacterota bacterium]